MAKGGYIGISGVARKIKKGYIGVDGVARKIKKGYIGVNGVAQLCFSSQHAITYHGNGGSGTMTQQVVEDGANVTLSANGFATPVATGVSYGAFTGWNTKADGSGVSYSAGQTITPTSNMTLYAQWKKQYYVYIGSEVALADVTNATNFQSYDQFDNTCGYVTIRGVKYTSATTVLVDPGEAISLKVSSSHSDQAYRCKVYLNGTLVQDGGGTYSWQVNAPTYIAFDETNNFVNWTMIAYWQAAIRMKS